MPVMSSAVCSEVQDGDGRRLRQTNQLDEAPQLVASTKTTTTKADPQRVNRQAGRYIMNMWVANATMAKRKNTTKVAQSRNRGEGLRERHNVITRHMP